MRRVEFAPVSVALRPDQKERLAILGAHVMATRAELIRAAIDQLLVRAGMPSASAWRAGSGPNGTTTAGTA